MKVELPSGEVAEFPDGTAPEVIERALQEQFPATPTGPVPGVDFDPGAPQTGYQQFLRDLPGAPQRADDLARLFAQGATFGMADPIAGYLSGTGPQAEGERTKAAGERTPTGVGTVTKLLGSLGSMALLPASSLPWAMTTGGAVGGAETVGRSLSETGELPTAGEVLTGVGTGVAAGGAGYGLGKFAGGLIDRWKGQNVPLEASRTLKDMGGAAYQQMDDAGISIRPSSYKNLVANIGKGLEKDFVSKDTAPEVMRALRILENAKDRNLSLRDLDKLRQTVRDILPKTASANDERMIGNILGYIDDYVDKLPSLPNAVVGGETEAGVNALKQGREFWRTSKKLEPFADVWDDIRLAAIQGRKSFSRATQDEVTKLYKSIRKNPQGFTEEEIDAFRNLAEGSLSQRVLNIVDRAIGQNLARPIAQVFEIPMRQAASNEAFRNLTETSEKLAPMMTPARQAVTPLLQQLGAKGGLLGELARRR